MSVRFPPGFVWGAATSGYQIEGAPEADGKGGSIWDRFAHLPGKTLHGDTGDRACDAYDPGRLEADLDLVAALGLKAYIFSVQWPRIQPTGRGRANTRGLDYYRRLVGGLLERSVMPVLTLYHWELPQALEDRGGWLDRDTVERFVDYAGLVYRTLASEVPVWITQNEPYTSSSLGYGTGKHAPGRSGAGNALIAAHHMLLSHGRVVQAFGGDAHTVFGPVINLAPLAPQHPASPADRAACRQRDGEQNRFFLEALFKGRYPADIARRVPHRHRGRAVVQQGDLDTIATPFDFLGVNYYMSQHVARGAGGVPEVCAESGETTAIGWAIDPEGLASVLRRVQRDYSGAMPLVVSENGASFRDYVDPEGRCHDPERIDFIERHLRVAARLIEEGVPLKAWFVWSLLDNFEWDSGYRERFGLVHVDYATQQRTPKSSFEWYRRLIERNALD